MLGAFGQLAAVQYSASASTVPLKHDIIIWKLYLTQPKLVAWPPFRGWVSRKQQDWWSCWQWGHQSNDPRCMAHSVHSVIPYTLGTFTDNWLWVQYWHIHTRTKHHISEVQMYKHYPYTCLTNFAILSLPVVRTLTHFGVNAHSTIVTTTSAAGWEYNNIYVIWIARFEDCEAENCIFLIWEQHQRVSLANTYTLY